MNNIKTLGIGIGLVMSGIVIGRVSKKNKKDISSDNYIGTLIISQVEENKPAEVYMKFNSLTPDDLLGLNEAKIRIITSGTKKDISH